jgi:hypothetical protein
MASVIKIKRSSTPGSVPSSLAAGEIAVNIPDRKFFVGDGSNIYRIGDQYLAVANAAATYQTKAVERAALANTNAYIATKVNTTTFNSALANTNSFIKAQLANTNAYIATKVNSTTFNSYVSNTNIWIRNQLANTNSYIATKVSSTTFNAALANTNLSITNNYNTERAALANTNLFIRAQLANTNSYIATKVNTTTFNSALANTNTYIATKVSASNPTTSGLLAHTGRATISTNLSVSGNTSVAGLKANNSLGSPGYFMRSNGTTAYWDALPPSTQYLQVVNANATFATKSNPTTSGVLAHTGRATISTNLAVSGNTQISGNLLVDGNLTVEGGVTYLSSSTLNVDDSMIKLSANNAGDAVDVGFYGKYVSSGTKYAGLFRDASDGIFKFYTGSQDEPGVTVDITATGYGVAQIEAVIDGGTY